MIKENGIRALSDISYDYYELKRDFGSLKKGAIFVHDPDDDLYGSIAEGCLKLCWTPDGNTYSGLCANTIFLHYRFAEDGEIFKKINTDKEIMKRINKLEEEIKRLKRKLDR
jgi:hypothetical protein